MIATESDFFRKPRSGASVYLAADTEGDRIKMSIWPYPVLNDDGTPVPYVTWDGVVYGNPVPHQITEKHEPGWLYRPLGACAERGDYQALLCSEWSAAGTPDFAERMVADPGVRWLLRMLSNVGEEMPAMLALGISAGITGRRPRAGLILREDDDRGDFYRGWQLGRVLAMFVERGEVEWFEGEEPEEWIARWRAFRADVSGADVDG